MHQPLRLAVVIEAPHQSIEAILGRHPQLRALFDNRWLHLMAIDDEGFRRREAPGLWLPVGEAEARERAA